MGGVKTRFRYKQVGAAVRRGPRWNKRRGAVLSSAVWVTYLAGTSSWPCAQHVTRTAKPLLYAAATPFCHRAAPRATAPVHCASAQTP